MEKTIFYADTIIQSNNEDGFVFNFVKDKNQVDDNITDYGFRIGMGPTAVKKFSHLLQLAVKEYESKYGEIRVKSANIKRIEDKPTTAAIGF